ncbi:MAG: crossover junction endodeoxyribonuclease RuvC [Acidobacteriota bacterium]
MRVLGLDPGSRHTGYAVLDALGDRLVPLALGRLSPPASKQLPSRLALLAAGLRELLDEHQPTLAVLETPFHGINARSLIVLAQARGALLAELASRDLEILEYSPATVKQAVTGSGRATKEQVARMVSLLLRRDLSDLSSDASDAVAVAICGARRVHWERLRQGGAGRGDG